MSHILVTGDLTADWNIARIRKGKAGGLAWNAVDTSRACLQPGGAAMLGDLLSEVLKGNKHTLDRIALPKGPILPEDPRMHHSYAVWEPYQKSTKEEKIHVWRVAEFIGLDSNGGQAANSKTASHYPNPEKADVVVIDDAGLGFRTNQKLWPKAILSGKPRWILVKAASPVAVNHPGTLWGHLIEHHADRTVALLTLNDLRRKPVQVSRELSWERLAQDLCWELTHNSAVSSLNLCRHAIVSMGPEGALLLSRIGKQDWNFRLVFDPEFCENSWSKQFEGMMVGYTVCLAAALTLELADTRTPDLEPTIRRGINAMRALHIGGFGVQNPEDQLSSPAFPHAEIARALTVPCKLASSPVQNPTRNLDPKHLPIGYRSGLWTILDEAYDQPNVLGDEDKPSLEKIAAKIVMNGYEQALGNVPLGRFGKFTTADRREIEGYQSIRALIGQYLKEPLGRPLCLGVFGPPGAGKSFGVKQVAKSVGKDKIVDITFNISQFEHPSELIDALHQVRDVGLAGKMPLVFWDEFDTGSLKWLRYFLAPMQDGEFQDGQITHHIGRAVFVFAGGTAATLAKFDKGRDDVEFRGSKGPDFISRLHGFLNILGPNPVCTDDHPDRHYLIRRAVLLRELLQRNAPSLLEKKKGETVLYIDRGILRAFLMVSCYKHGVRSMESIIASSLLSGKTGYERSSLPPEWQLDVHVNGREFLALVQEPILEGDLLEHLAESLHEVYRTIGDNPNAKMKYNQLTEDFQIENRRNVLDMVDKLRSIGYILTPARTSQATLKLTKDEIELLAEKEHWRWCLSKLSRGWVHNPKRENEKLHHDCLLPWRKMSNLEWKRIEPWIAVRMGRDALPEIEKEKDRVVVRAIPKILARAGYAVEKVGGFGKSY